jgi:hypothetical protein
MVLGAVKGVTGAGIEAGAAGMVVSLVGIASLFSSEARTMVVEVRRVRMAAAGQRLRAEPAAVEAAARRDEASIMLLCFGDGGGVVMAAS